MGVVENRGRSTVVLGVAAGPEEEKGRKGFGVDLDAVAELTAGGFVPEEVFREEGRGSRVKFRRRSRSIEVKLTTISSKSCFQRCLDAVDASLNCGVILFHSW